MKYESWVKKYEKVRRSLSKSDRSNYLTYKQLTKKQGRPSLESLKRRVKSMRAVSQYGYTNYKTKIFKNNLIKAWRNNVEFSNSRIFDYLYSQIQFMSVNTFNQFYNFVKENSLIKEETFNINIFYAGSNEDLSYNTNKLVNLLDEFLSKQGISHKEPSNYFGYDISEGWSEYEDF